VQLPDNVRRLIDEHADALGFPALKRAAALMSDAYRDGRVAPLNDAERTAAYLVTRMPATYAASYIVLRELRERIGAVSSILDLGAGTGAASLAARQCFPDASITMIERDAALSEAARFWLPDAEILTANVRKLASLKPADLVVAAYSLGEFGEATATLMWQSARIAMVAIEPGTPRGFGLIREIRDELLAAGAHMAAPCPGPVPCPMVAPDWCHFAARVERSSIHRRIKDAELNYEDEKFSYVALAREPVKIASARILRRPQHRPGLIVLETCTAEGLRTERVTKRNRESFRAARQASWGDAIDS
jgi:ribosomal protein RSM22 (predicted rRNA methylase)